MQLKLMAMMYERLALLFSLEGSVQSSKYDGDGRCLVFSDNLY